MTQEKYFIKRRIERLEQRKESLVNVFIGACNEINNEIKELKKQLKEQEINTKKGKVKESGNNGTVE